MNYEDTTKDNLQLGTKCCNAGRKWHSGVPNNGSYWVCAKCNKPLGDVAPTEPVEKCMKAHCKCMQLSPCSNHHYSDCRPTEPVIEDWDIQQIKSEASIFFSKISEYLPKSLERSALGDEKIYHAFYQAFIEMRPYISRQTRLDLLNEIEGEIIEKKKSLELNYEGTEFEAPKDCSCIWGEGNCESCTNYEFNTGLQVGVDIIRSKMK